MVKLRKKRSAIYFSHFLEKKVDEVGVDEMGVDEMGSRRSGNNPIFLFDLT